MDKENLDLSIYDVRTDLALEAHENASSKGITKQIEGVEISTEDTEIVKITRLHVLNEKGERAIGKIPGKYLTLEVPGLRKQDTDLHHAVTKILVKELQSFLEVCGIQADDKCLVIGLGNWNVTPDSLGPKVVENLLVTRHLFELMPQNVDKGYRNVSALSPGVLGITGIETSDIVRAVVQESRPEFVIAIDALASRSLERVNTTIQISDTGIHPGSGIGNKRKAISKDTLHIPVIAIGVPTVVDAVSVANDTIDYLLAHLGRQMKENSQPKPKSRLLADAFSPLYDNAPVFTEEDIPTKEVRQSLMGMVGMLEEGEKRQLIKEILQPLGHNLIVTPKEVDSFIEDIGNIVANGINAALHNGITMDTVSAYTH